MVTVNKLFLQKKRNCHPSAKTKYFLHPRQEKIVFTEIVFPCDIYTGQSREEQGEFSRQILSFPVRSKRRTMSTMNQLMKTL